MPILCFTKLCSSASTVSAGGSRKEAWASAKEPCGVREPLAPMRREGKAVATCWAGGAWMVAAVLVEEGRDDIKAAAADRDGWMAKWILRL
eukprot:scaffold119874_cov21-Cyclotella_meneghiniana.AAC.2